MKFKRYGSLIPQEHKIHNGDWHIAPMKMGIYAFPVGFEEDFLLGGVGAGNIQNGRYRFLRDKNKKKIFCSYNELFVPNSIDEKLHISDKYKILLKGIDPYKIYPYYIGDDGLLEFPVITYNTDKKFNWVIENEPIKFEYNGDIWCHFMFVAKRYEILNQIGDWILVDIKTYKTLLKRYTNVIKFDDYKAWGNTLILGNGINGYPISKFSKDYFEVFIENPKKNC
jgi:hypothetical protein